MITSPQQRIKEYTERNWWGHETLHDLLQRQVEKIPNYWLLQISLIEAN